MYITNFIGTTKIIWKKQLQITKIKTESYNINQSKRGGKKGKMKQWIDERENK